MCQVASAPHQSNPTALSKGEKCQPGERPTCPHLHPSVSRRKSPSHHPCFLLRDVLQGKSKTWRGTYVRPNAFDECEQFDQPTWQKGARTGCVLTVIAKALSCCVQGLCETGETVDLLAWFLRLHSMFAHFTRRIFLAECSCSISAAKALLVFDAGSRKDHWHLPAKIGVCRRVRDDLPSGDEPFAPLPAGFRCLLWPPLPEHHQLLCLLYETSCEGCATRKEFSTA